MVKGIEKTRLSRNYQSIAALALMFSGSTAVLAGCATADRNTPRAYAQQSERLPSASVIPSETGPIRVERLAALEEPWGMSFLPDGRLLITEKPGRLRIFSQGRLSPAVEGTPQVVHFGQGGLLDVEVDPNFAQNRLVYLSYTEAAEQQPPIMTPDIDPRLGAFQRREDRTLKGGAVARGRLEGNALRDLTVIWRQVPKTIGRGHYGGRLAFAPDGTLFISSGERMRFDPAQSVASNLGKIARINSDGSIPPDNPFTNADGSRSDIWSTGHRNPLSLGFEPSTGRLWETEMGPEGGDELNLIERGKNYGWPAVSEGVNYDESPIPKHRTRPQFTRFVRTWTPVISPSGLLFYTGTQFPPWRGNAFIGGLSSQSLIRLTLSGTEVAGEEKIAMGRRIRDVIQAPDGSIFLISEAPNAELLRLSPAR